MQTRIERIRKDTETLARFTFTPGKGMTRSSYSKEDTTTKYYLTREMKKIDLEVYEGGFGILPGCHRGTVKDAPVVMLSSHYDSVVNGGALDGAAGSVSALETACVFAEKGFVNDYSLELILISAEEGATFGPSTGISNSRAMLETVTQHELETTRSRFDQTELEAMAGYSLKSDLKAAIHKPGPIKDFLELYIEQGPVLRRKNIGTDLIRYLAGVGRYTIRFRGTTADSTMPMDSRRDALATAASFIAEFDRQIRALGPDITGIVGKLDITPNSSQFVPGYVEGRIEVHTFSRECIEKTNFEELIIAVLNAVGTEYDIRTELKEVMRIDYPDPVEPNAMCAKNVAKVEAVCGELRYSHVIINDGTGHDPTAMTDFCDTNVIHVPGSRGGMSCCPEEWTEYANIREGADILLHLVMDLSKNK